MEKSMLTILKMNLLQTFSSESEWTEGTRERLYSFAINGWEKSVSPLDGRCCSSSSTKSYENRGSCQNTANKKRALGKLYYRNGQDDQKPPGGGFWKLWWLWPEENGMKSNVIFVIILQGGKPELRSRIGTSKGSRERKRAWTGLVA